MTYANNRKNRPNRRICRTEFLEERALLSAVPLTDAEYLDLAAQYSALNLPETAADLNIITLDLSEGDGLSSLKSAIAEAGTTAASDLIVVRTTGIANTITYAAATDEIAINIDSTQFGSISIVSLGTQNLTLDASQFCRVMSVSGSTTVANLGGLTVTNGKSTGSASNANYGGGIYNSYGTLTVTNSTISGNTAGSYGGGIYNYYGTLTANNSIITDTIYRYRSSGTIQGSNNLSTYTAWSSGTNNIVYDSSIPLFVDAANGDYRILPGSQAYNAGSNELALAAGLTYDSKDNTGMPRITDEFIDIGAYECYTVSAPIALNKATSGKLTTENQYTQFYSFAVNEATTVSFSLLQGDWAGLSVKMFGPGFSQFLTCEPGEFALPDAGTYYLRVQPAVINTPQSYAFRMNSHDAAELSVGTAYEGTIPASRYAKLFQVTTTETKVLQLFLDAETTTVRNEIYVRYGSAPTRSDYDYSSASGTPDQTLTIDNAAPGTYYVLVYGDYCPIKSNYTLTANLTSIILDDYAQTGVGTDTLEFTISGAGFDDSTAVYAVDTQTGTATAAASSKVTANGQIVAQFAKTLAAGDYTIRLVKGDDTADSTKTFTYSGLYVSGLKVDLTTNLVIPGNMGRHYLATIYIEYTNNSNFAIASPLLKLTATNNYNQHQAIMTLDASRIAKLSTGF